MAKFSSYLEAAFRGLEGYMDCIIKWMFNYH